MTDIESDTETNNTGKNQSVEHWVRVLNQQEMPVFSHTATSIAGQATKESITASQLANEILQDPTMTIRVLKMANNIYHNPGHGSIGTVSRAIVLLGFETVRSLCLSLAILDAKVKGRQKDRMLDEMATSFHAAIQAKTLAERRRDESPEEVFIATLLYHLGRMTFWCFSDAFDKSLAPKLDAALSKPGVTPEEAEKEVLGFELGDLTNELNKQWHLSSLLEEVKEGVEGENPRVSNLTLGYELAEQAKKGWNCPETKELMERIAETLYLPLDSVTELVHENAYEATLTMSTLGSSEVGKLIPLPPTYAENEPEERIPVRQYLEPDRTLQLEILGDLTQMLEDNLNINQLLEMVLEGIYRGIGMDRTLFALLAPDRRGIKSKYSLGWDKQKMTGQFRFEVSASEKNIIDLVIQSRKAVWIPEIPKPEISTFVRPCIKEVIGDCSFFMGPIIVSNTVIGLFYADRAHSKRELDEESFTSFKLFNQQANLGLSSMQKT